MTPLLWVALATTPLAAQVPPCARNRPPTVTLEPEVGSCHPVSQGKPSPCEISVHAQGTDPDGKLPITYQWSGCCSGRGSSSLCKIEHVGTRVCGVIVRDECRATATMERELLGTNEPPVATIDVHPCATVGADGACAFKLAAHVSDRDGDPVRSGWSGCASGTAASSLCVVKPGAAVFATLVAADPLGATTTATVWPLVVPQVIERSSPAPSPPAIELRGSSPFQVAGTGLASECRKEGERTICLLKMAPTASGTIVAEVTVPSPPPSPPPREEFYSRRVNWTAGLGYAHVSATISDLPRDLRIHANHRDDLLAGDPGETNLTRIALDLATVELGASVRLASNVALLGQYAAWVPFDQVGRLERQQINDGRTPSTASYIYTELGEVTTGHGLRGGLALGVPLSRARGWWAELQASLEVARLDVTFSKGWTRGGSDEVETGSTARALYLGAPAVRLAVGARRFAMFATLTRTRFNFDHGDSRLEAHSASGVQVHLGAQVGLGGARTGR